MVVHHRREREDRWRLKATINGVGAVTTGVIAAVVVISKFTQGAWIPAVVIPLMVILFRLIKHHYAGLGAALRLTEGERPRPITNTMVVLVGGLHRGTVAGIEYAKALAPEHLIAVHICETEAEGDAMARRWKEYEDEIELDIVVDPYRNLRGTVHRFIAEVEQRWDDDRITVIIPEFVVHRWWEHLLHNQAALFLKGTLLFKDNVVVVSVPYQVVI